MVSAVISKITADTRVIFLSADLSVQNECYFHREHVPNDYAYMIYSAIAWLAVRPYFLLIDRIGGYRFGPPRPIRRLLLVHRYSLLPRILFAIPFVLQPWFDP